MITILRWPITLTLIKDGYVTHLNSKMTPDNTDAPFHEQYTLYRELMIQFDQFFIRGWSVVGGSDEISFSQYQTMLYINNIMSGAGSATWNILRAGRMPIAASQYDLVTIEHQLHYNYLVKSYYHLWRMKSSSSPTWYRFDSTWEAIPWNETLTKTTLMFKLTAPGRYPIAVEYGDTVNGIASESLECNFNSSTSELTIVMSEPGPFFEIHPNLLITPVSGLGLSDKEIIAASINSVVSNYDTTVNAKIDNLSKIYQR